MARPPPRDPRSIAAPGARFLAAFPHGVPWNPFKYVFKVVHVISGGVGHLAVSDDVKRALRYKTTWQQRASSILMMLLWLLNIPTAIVGWSIETIGNTIVANGGVLRTLYHILLTPFVWIMTRSIPLIMPDRRFADYLSIVGLIDPRTSLFVDTSDAGREEWDKATAYIFPGSRDFGNRRTGDVSVMASKLAYENRAVIKKVVDEVWNMHFVEYFDCWNDYQRRKGTQAFMFTDRVNDANAVVVAWRGTQTFDNYDWSTDIDFSWFDMGKMGKVHIGFLEALGLGTRKNMKTFHHMRQKIEFIRRTVELNKVLEGSAASGLPQELIDATDKSLAYDDVTKKVKEVLAANPKAKLYITGHSLGGALADLYVGLLSYNNEDTVTERIAAVYTFGQPRVGDQQYANFMLSRQTPLTYHYYRVVYSNDLVPRVPFDDDLFQFKHWGLCVYFNSLFQEQTLKDEPNANFFNVKDLLGVRLNAIWELFYSLLLPIRYGSEFQDSMTSILYRITGLALPGLGAHSPANYVNAMRLSTPSYGVFTNLGGLYVGGKVP